eukprot:8460796-Lingulodinium_polyedra.AAC.1
MLKASEAMAGPRPSGTAAALEEVASKISGAPGERQQQCLGLLRQLLTLGGGSPCPMASAGGA